MISLALGAVIKNHSNEPTCAHNALQRGSHHSTYPLPVQSCPCKCSQVPVNGRGGALHHLLQDICMVPSFNLALAIKMCFYPWELSYCVKGAIWHQAIYMNTHTHTDMHTQTHTHTHVRTHANTHTHVCTHTWKSAQWNCLGIPTQRKANIIFILYIIFYYINIS